jgi:hypothetical protein
MILAAVLVLGGLLFFFKDEVFSSKADSNNGNIKVTDVIINTNCPIEPQTISNLIDIYGDNSFPRITISRMDLKGNNKVILEPVFSWLNGFKASFFPLTRADLEVDLANYKAKAISDEVQRLLTTPQSVGADCDYKNINADYNLGVKQLTGSTLIANINKSVFEGKNRIVFKVISCPESPQTSVAKTPVNKPADQETKPVNSDKVEKNTPPTKKLEFSYSPTSIRWGIDEVENYKSDVFSFEFELLRSGELIKSGKIQFAVSSTGIKNISSKEILNAGGRDFINYCHGRDCALKIYHKSKLYQTLYIKGVDCNDFHK